MSDILTVTISGPPDDVDRILRRLGGGEQPLQVVRANGVTEHAPDQNHTEPVVATTLTSPLPEVTRIAIPRRDKRKRGIPPHGPDGQPKLTTSDEADLELLSALTGELRPAVDIAVGMGIKRTSCGGVARRLDRLADTGRCERGELPDGKRGYRRLGTAVAAPEPPAPPVDLPQRPPYLHLGDLTGHALLVAWALHDHGPLTRHELAERLELPEGETRETVRMLIRQGYVTRLEGNVVRYALTDGVVREEVSSE